MRERKERGIRRILVALDASGPSLSALETAVELAAGLRAELEGLFVHDRQLLQLARLSTLQEVDALSAELRSVEQEGVERQLRLQGRRARRAIQRLADSRRVRWTFRTASGSVEAELRTAAGRADLLILGFRSATPGRGPGSTARALLHHPGVPLMLLGRRARLGTTVFVLWDGSEAGKRALDVAAALAAPREVGLTLLLSGGTEGLREEAEEAVDPLGVTARVVRLAGRSADLREVAAAVRTGGCGLFVAPLGALPEEDRKLGELLGTVKCPVLMVE